MRREHGKQVATHLYGQEINAETYAICKADLLLKGEGEEADNIVGGPEYSTLSHDAFPPREFDFMLSNPPYGKSWKSDLGADGRQGRTCSDPRFVIEHAGDPEYCLVTRSSDGQMLFLANMLSKMKQGTTLGSRIAEVHNGSSLFTGDAGQGESNIRRWIIENDWLEAIVALPLNMFYNTGIATYIWVLTNRKPEHRGAARCNSSTPRVVQAAPQEPRQEELRTRRRRHRAHLRRLPGVRGNRAVENLSQRRASATGRSPSSVRLRLSVDLSAIQAQSLPADLRRAGEEPVASLVDHVHLRARRRPAQGFRRVHRKCSGRRRREGCEDLRQAREASADPLCRAGMRLPNASFRRVHKQGKVEADPLHGLFASTSAASTLWSNTSLIPNCATAEQVPLSKNPAALTPSSTGSFATRVRRVGRQERQDGNWLRDQLQPLFL